MGLMLLKWSFAVPHILFDMENKEKCACCLQTLFKHHRIIFMFVLAAKVPMQSAVFGFFA